MANISIPKYEERQILELLRSVMDRIPPVIVDVGGNKDADISDPFIRLGWRSLIVEPQPACVALLRAKYRNFANCRIVQGACSDAPGKLKLYRGVDGHLSEVATLSDRSDPWMDQVRSKEFDWIDVVRLGDLLEQISFPTTIGILKIDTESWDGRVLKGLDLEAVTVSVIVTEEYYWDVEGTLSKHLYLEEAGFVNLGFVGYNTIWMNGALGARFSFVMLKTWLNDLGAYPEDLLGNGVITTNDPQLERREQASAPVRLGGVLILAEPVDALTCGSEVSLRLLIVNMETGIIGSGASAPRISYHWLRNAFEAVSWDCGNVALPEPIGPGGALDVAVIIRAPEEAGRYVLRIDLVEDGVGWFYDRGATVAEQSVTVLSAQ